MKSNISGTDRVIRVVLAILLFVLGLTGVLTGALAIAGYVLAVVFLATAAVNFCPLYALFKLSTRKA